MRWKSGEPRLRRVLPPPSIHAKKRLVAHATQSRSGRMNIKITADKRNVCDTL